MKKYIGTKEVEAEPMTMGEAYEKGLLQVGLQVGRIPGIYQKDKPGYHVKYKDGFGSWQSAELFEERYKLADTAHDRMLIEGEQLTEKLQKLQMFACTSKFMELDDTTKAMLVAQACVMEEYQIILNQRYTRMESGEGSLSGLPFSVATSLLRAGFAIRRASWKEQGVFVVKQVPAHIDSDIIPKMQSLPQSVKNLIMKGKGFIDYTAQCLIYNTNTGRADSWNPSIADVFAEDWEIVAE